MSALPQDRAAGSARASTPAPSPADTRLPPAPLVRRMLCAVYETMLLFGVVFGTSLVFSVVTDQRHGLAGRSGQMAVNFLVLACYFIGFWLRGGQTLAMKTWHVRLQRTDGRPLRPRQAMFRFLTSWVWVLPPLFVVWALGLGRVGAAYAVTSLLWIGGYAALATRHPRRQFLHDALCGTELVDTRALPAPAART